MAEVLYQASLFGPPQEILVWDRFGQLLSSVEGSGFRQYLCRRCQFLWEFYDATKPTERQPCPACEVDVNEDRGRQRPAPTTARERYQQAHAAYRRYMTVDHDSDPGLVSVMAASSARRAARVSGGT